MSLFLDKTTMDVANAIRKILEAKVEPSAPDPEAVARKKRMDALRDKLDSERGEKEPAEKTEPKKRVHAGTSYGNQPETEKDDDDKPAAAAPVKRGRGRPRKIREMLEIYRAHKKLQEEPDNEQFKKELEDAKSKAEGKTKAKVADAAVQAVKEVDEEVEQIDEISKKTLGSYVAKAAPDIATKAANSIGLRDLANSERGNKADWNAAARMHSKTLKRIKGVGKAAARLAKEETEQIDEISKKTLGSYVKKAAANLGNKAAEAGHYNAKAAKPGYGVDGVNAHRAMEKARKREQGIGLAVDKMTREEVEQIEEGGVGGLVPLNKAGDAVKKLTANLQKSGIKVGKSTTTVITKSGKKVTKEETEQIDETSKAKFIGVAKHRADPYADEYGDKETTRTDGAVKNMSALAAKQHGAKFAKDLEGVGKSKPKSYGHDKLSDRKPVRVTASGKANKTDIKGLKTKIKNEEVEQIDEISADTKTSYVQKATQQVKDLKPHAKKGEYKDIAQNIINRRKRGLALAKEETEQNDE